MSSKKGRFICVAAPKGRVCTVPRGGYFLPIKKDRFCRGPPKLATFLDFNESLCKNHSNFQFKHIWQAGLPSWLRGTPRLWMDFLRFPPCRVTKLRKVEREFAVLVTQYGVVSQFELSRKKYTHFWDNGSVPLGLKFLFKIFPFKIVVTPKFFVFDTLKSKLFLTKNVYRFLPGGMLWNTTASMVLSGRGFPYFGGVDPRKKKKNMFHILKINRWNLPNHPGLTWKRNKSSQPSTLHFWGSSS